MDFWHCKLQVLTCRVSVEHCCLCDSEACVARAIVVVIVAVAFHLQKCLKINSSPAKVLSRITLIIKNAQTCIISSILFKTECLINIQIP